MYLSDNIFHLHTSFLEIASGLALMGLGVGIISPHLSNLAFLCIIQDKQPDASAIWNTNSNLNSSMGTAILGLILLMGTFNALSVKKLVSGIINAFYVLTLILFLGLIITQFVKSKKKG